MHSNGSAITAYEIVSNPGSRTVVAGPGTTEAVVDGLTNGVAYTFTVSASNGSGKGLGSVPTNAVEPSLGVEFASDLQPSTATNGWGPIERDRSNGEDAAGDGAVISLDGRRYAKGLGVHAHSVVTYDLTTPCTVFGADVGVDGEVGDRGSVDFRVSTDMGLSAGANASGRFFTEHLSLDLTGATRLTLEVTDGEDGPSSDHADWANAYLTCPPAGSPPSPSGPPQPGSAGPPAPGSSPPGPAAAAGTSAAPVAAPVSNPAPSTELGPASYLLVDERGAVYAFGRAHWLGNAPVGNVPAVDVESSKRGDGYWVLDAAGHVFAFGNAPYLGGPPPLRPGESATSISATPDNTGYWLFTSQGRAIAYGTAPPAGDMSGTRLNGPVIDSVATPSGRGYWMVASDGGVFTFGDAVFAGSMGDTRLNAPIRALAPARNGGYWLVAVDGGVFAFGAPFFGSMGATHLNGPVAGMVGVSSADNAGRGYVMVGQDGGVFTFGAAEFSGSLGGSPPSAKVVSLAAL